MNFHEFCDRFHISQRKARLMLKADVLRLDETTSEIAIRIRGLLAKGQPLTAAQLCALVESPGMLLDLGRYAGAAQEQVEALGDAKAEAAPKHVVAYIGDAVKKDPQTVVILIDWLKSIIPARPIPHNYIAVRLLLGLTPNVREFDVPRVPRALRECRRHADFAGWWCVDRQSGRTKTYYSQPAKKPVAEFDL
jgi:hypothetical protein